MSDKQMPDEQIIDNTNGDEATHPKSQNLGLSLQAARLEKKLSQQDVSNSLRYSVKQIEALENNAFDILPDAMMTRGFIRSYAKYLQIDAEPLLDAYRASLGDDTEKVISVRSSMRPVALTKENQSWLKYILASIVVLLFLVVWIAYVEYMPKQAPIAEPSTQPNSQQSDVETNLELPVMPSPEQTVPEVVLPTDDGAAEPKTSNAIDAPVATQANYGAASQANAANETSLTPPTTATQPTADAQQNSAAMKSITFRFSGESWVNITDKSGKVVYEKLARSGEVETIKAIPPLNVVVGNASETQLNFSGQDIDLSTNVKNNVARVTLE